MDSWVSNLLGNQNSNVIYEIKELKKQGKEIHLFVGRAPLSNDLPLPINTESEIWISLSTIRPDETENWIIDPKRLHLIMDCNTPEIHKINGLFKTVVVDRSTSKFFANVALENLSNIVAEGGSLIIPSELAAQPTLSPNPPLSYFQYTYIKCNRITEFNVKNEYEEENDLSKKITQTELLKYFNSVEICNEVFPFKNKYDNNGAKTTTYFHATEKNPFYPIEANGFCNIF